MKTGVYKMYLLVLCLLHFGFIAGVKAEDKAFITHTTDTLMLRLVDYYETVGDKTFLPTAYYYAGRVYNDMNDDTRALRFFQKTAEMIDSCSTLYGPLYSQMGYLFLYQGIYDKGIEAFSRAYRQYKRVRNKVGIAAALCGIAFCQQRQGMELEALRHFKQAIALTREAGDKSYEADIIGQIANCCAPNALMTLKEYGEDYASPDTKRLIDEMIAREIPMIPNEAIRRKAADNIDSIVKGERDFRF